MNYPVWEIPFISGAGIIAAIAILHVFVSHLAIGAGLLLVLTEHKAYREGDERILAYTRRNARLLILLSLVIGALTGVGIWWSIGLVQPSGTSTLIHVFVWAWAIEWTFFLVEIVSAFVYYYAWDRLDRRTHLTVGWLYFGAAWMSLFVINGILSFMLTPGDWIETGSVWDGFFNPTFLPSLVMRTGVVIALAGLYALFTASFISDNELRSKMVRYASRWLAPAFFLLPIGGIWFFTQAPSLARELAFGEAPTVTFFLAASLGFSIILFSLGFTGSLWQPRRFTPVFATGLLILGLFVTGTSEWVREAVRKPFIIYDYMYSNSVLLADTDELRIDGVLQRARWAEVKEVTPENMVEAGEEYFRLQCSSCHAVEGYNGIGPLVDGWSEQFTYEQLAHLDTLKEFMPPFLGTDEERRALAAYLASLSDQEETLPASAATEGILEP
jgi:cytochrome bd-type quinol oxidase subunit 1